MTNWSRGNILLILLLVIISVSLGIWGLNASGMITIGRQPVEPVEETTSQTNTASNVNAVSPTGSVSQIEAPTLISPGPNVPANVLSEVSGIKEIIPVETLKATFKNKYTQASVTSNASVWFYVPGAKVSDPNVQPLDRLDSGSGQTTAFIIQTNTAYDTYINGSAVYYDKKITPSISYNPKTGNGYLLLDGIAYVPMSPIGAFVTLDSLPELQGSNVIVDTGTNRLSYNETAGGGSGWFRMDIGNNNANSEIQDAVFCLTDNNGDMENDELTGFTATYVSGSRSINLPGDILEYWRRAMGGNTECMQMASVLGSSEKARWEFTMTADETNWAGSEEFEIRLDDLGDYLEKQYPSAHAKVSAVTLTVNTTA